MIFLPIHISAPDVSIFISLTCRLCCSNNFSSHNFRIHTVCSFNKSPILLWLVRSNCISMEFFSKSMIFRWFFETVFDLNQSTYMKYNIISYIISNLLYSYNLRDDSICQRLRSKTLIQTNFCLSKVIKKPPHTSKSICISIKWCLHFWNFWSRNRNNGIVIFFR